GVSKGSTSSILGNLPTADLAPHARTEIQRMIVSGLDLPSRRIIGPEVACHAPLSLGDKFNGCDELRRLIAVARRVDEAKRGAVAIRERLAGHVQDHEDTWRLEVLDG